MNILRKVGHIPQYSREIPLLSAGEMFLCNSKRIHLAARPQINSLLLGKGGSKIGHLLREEPLPLLCLGSQFNIKKSRVFGYVLYITQPHPHLHQLGVEMKRTIKASDLIGLEVPHILNVFDEALQISPFPRSRHILFLQHLAVVKRDLVQIIKWLEIGGSLDAVALDHPAGLLNKLAA